TGQVAGNGTLPSGDFRGYRTAPNSTINLATDLMPTLGGTTSFVGGINSSGQVGGTASNALEHQHAVRFDADGTIHDLGFLGGTVHDGSNGNAISDSGQVTGASNAARTPFGPPCFGTGGLYGFRTAPNSAIVPADNLATLLGLCRYSVGFGINNAG